MSERDRRWWDRRWSETGLDQSHAGVEVSTPRFLTNNLVDLPVAGHALDLACGLGQDAIWLAQRGLDVQAVDISAVAIDKARQAAVRAGVESRCRFQVHDLDDGLAPVTQVDVVLCHRFFDRALFGQIVDCLVPGGLASIATLSEVDASPGRFRAKPGELKSIADTFHVELIDSEEMAGEARILVRRLPGSVKR